MSWWNERSAGRLQQEELPITSWSWQELVTGPSGRLPDNRPRTLESKGVEPCLDELEAAKAEAYEQGVSDGMAQASQEMREPLLVLERLVEHLEAKSDEARKSAEERVQILALAVARVLLEREIRAGPDEVTQLVRRAVSRFPSEEALCIRMNPEDLSALAQPVEGEGLPPALGRGGALQWEADKELERGDVVIEAADRILDGRIIPCLERIWEELRDDE